jgi:hypothetical protein
MLADLIRDQSSGARAPAAHREFTRLGQQHASDSRYVNKPQTRQGFGQPLAKRLFVHKHRRPMLLIPWHLLLPRPDQVAAMIRPSWKVWICLALSSISVPAVAADNVVREFANGSGPNAVGVIDASVDTETAGPQALYAGEHGDLFLLDQVNNRILQFDPKRPAGETRALEFSPELQPSDLIVRKNDILVWDGSVHTLTPTGDDNAPTRGLEEVNTRGADDEFTLSTFAQMGSQRPGNDTDLIEDNSRGIAKSQPHQRTRQYVASRGRGPVVVDVILDKGGASAHIEVRPRGEVKPIATLRLSVRDRLGAVEFLEIDNSGRMFVLAENIPPLAEGAAVFVARFSPAGSLDGIYELPLSQNASPSRRFVTVSADGDVYFLRTQKNAVEVVGVGFRSLKGNRLIDIRPPQVVSFGKPGREKQPLAAVRPLTRQQVVQTAFAFEGVQWNVSRSAYGPDPDTACTGFRRIRRPGYLHGKLGQEVRGMPYCWGCHGSLAQIRARLERGALAGNVCTRNAPRTDTVGVDCSAFVSAAWGLATHFTTAAIPAIASRLSNPWDLKPGDALNKPGSHVMLFLRLTPDRKAEVMESSPGACNGRVCRNVYPLASLLARGYVPVRFRALAGDNTVVAQRPEAGTERPAHARARAR